MSYRYPYAPDNNPPPGIPQAYPYGPPPLPTSNPMHPPGFLVTNESVPNSSMYSTNSSYSSAFSHSSPRSSPYPSDLTTSYPPTSPYPANISSYPSPSPYPASNFSAYPSTAVPYPHAPPNNHSPYSSNISPYSSNVNSAASVPYPPINSSYPKAAPSYPTGNSLAGLRSSTNLGSSINCQRSFTGHRNMAQFYATEGTVKPFANFDPKQDAEVLRKAMKGFGTDEKSIINVLAKRSNSQRVYIAVAFKQLYGKDLIDDLKSELKGNFEDVVVGLMTPTNDYLASEVHKSISGIGTDEDVLIEILCTRTNQEIWAINEAYQRLYGKTLEADVKSDTSGYFQRLLVSVCTGARSEAPADEERAKQTAHTLYAAGVGQWGTDESVFNSILVAESFHQLALTFYEYQKLAGHTVAEAIDKEMSGDLKKGMLAIARTVENRPFYFAEKLYKAMKGLGTDDRTLIRIVVTRCEVDMVQIKAEYERNYGKPLADAIHGDTSGDYRRLLIALVNGY